MGSTPTQARTLAFRLQNYAEIDPVVNHPYASKGLKACHEQRAKAFGWQ
jgi:xanthine dehydrogenase YagR molybdenum-binding subunit